MNHFNNNKSGQEIQEYYIQYNRMGEVSIIGDIAEDCSNNNHWRIYGDVMRRKQKRKSKRV